MSTSADTAPDETHTVLQVLPYPEEALLQNIHTQQSEDKEIVSIRDCLEKGITFTQ